MTTYRLKKDLPFAKAGAEVIKYDGNPAPDYIKERAGWFGEWRVKVSNMKYVWIGSVKDDMTEWIEEVEERMNLFPKDNPNVSLREQFGAMYKVYKIRGYQGKFHGYPIENLSNSDLCFIIAYLEAFIKGE